MTDRAGIHALTSALSRGDYRPVSATLRLPDGERVPLRIMPAPHALGASK